jgi:hypothetical protein
MHVFYVKEHEEHHMKLYPPTDYYSKTYRDPSSGSSLKSNLWFAVAGLITAAGVWALFDWKHAGVFLAVGIADALFNQYIHNAKHITGHWLGRFWPTRHWFRWIQHRHLIHHIELHANLGMYNYVWDTLLRVIGMGTVRKDIRPNWQEDSPWAERDRKMKEAA